MCKETREIAKTKSEFMYPKHYQETCKQPKAVLLIMIGQIHLLCKLITFAASFTNMVVWRGTLLKMSVPDFTAIAIKRFNSYNNNFIFFEV